ncbi:MAG: hypothetical protein HYV27_14855 [Candidatus Hydrogenedentes bacterium]|nr:hypothetical protein [Candidatus Hydrogenedentota bacterium]
MVRLYRALIAAIVAAGLCGSGAAWADSAAEMAAAGKAYDLAALASVQTKLDAEAGEASDNYGAQRAAAECYALRASIHRQDRHIQKLDGKTGEAKRAEQERWGTAGMVFAERALELAKTDEEKAQAHRLIGELYSHLITGMITGMRNGPKARKHVESALELAPKDFECNRAIGIMYLHNPPISGGDIDKAISTFKMCSAGDPKNDRYLVLLSMAYRKKGETNLAADAARQALAVNPKNLDARHLLDVLK